MYIFVCILKLEKKSIGKLVEEIRKENNFVPDMPESTQANMQILRATLTLNDILCSVLCVLALPTQNFIEYFLVALLRE